MNTAKAIKDLSFKSRFLPSYGADEDLYQQSLDYMRYWLDKLFIIEEDSFKQQVSQDLLHNVNIEVAPADAFPAMTAKPINGEELKNKLRLDNTMNIDIQDTAHELKFGDTVDLQSIDRNACTLYTGGLVTSLAWLPKTVNSHQYLAVSVINGDSDIKSLVESEQLSIFHTKNAKSSNSPLHTCLQIWQLDVDTQKWSLYQLLDTTRFGACNNISWVPLHFQDILGVLGGSYKDGKLHFFKLQLSGPDPEYLEIVNSSISYGLQNPRATNEPLAMTSYDYLSNDRVIAGFTDGSIAEFILPTYPQFASTDLNESNYKIPSFVHNLADTPISSVSVGNPVANKYIVQVNTYGLSNFIFEYDNFKSQRLESFGSTLQPVYHDQLKVFVCLDSYDVAAYAFARHPHERQSLFLKTDGVITSYGVSKYLNHPMVLVSGSYGELFIVNIVRKILSPAKTSNKALSPLRLWKLSYNAEGKDGLALNFAVEPVPPDKTNKITTSPEQVCISCCGWNENLDGSSMYAAGTHCGLLVVDRLDS